MKLDAPGLYALEPSAFGVDQMVDLLKSCGPAEVRGNVAIVTVRGLLTYGGAVADGPAISYSDVVNRVREACAGVNGQKPLAVVLHLGSPGGDVAGAFDSARLIKAAAQAAGVRLVSYTDSQCCSAAYALATGCEEITASSTAVIGSVGVIRVMKTAVAAEKALGLQTALVTSGARKADGNPSIALTPEALAAAQVQVDTMAAEFFRLVGESRGDRGLTAEAAIALEAGVFVGQAAVDVHLADRVVPSLDALISELQTPRLLASVPESSSKDAMSDENKKDEKKEDAMRASLVTASESDDPEKAARAKRALAAYDTEEDEDKKEDKAVAAAASEDKEDKAVSALAARVQELSASLAARDERDAAAAADAFYAANAHLDGELVKTLRALPLDKAKDIVAKLPKNSPAALAAVPGGVIPGATQTDRKTPQMSAEARAKLDIAMGLAKLERVNSEDDFRQTFGAVVVK